MLDFDFLGSGGSLIASRLELNIQRFLVFFFFIFSHLDVCVFVKK